VQARALDALEAAPAAPEDPLLAGAPVLERAALVAEVLRRNPTVAAARHAWRAALARYPQETAFDDPIFAYSLGPRTFGSDRVAQEAHRFDLSQAIPFPGKLALRGTAALAESEAMAGEHDAVRLRLATLASMLYDEHWLLAREAEITQEHLVLVRELRAVATARYASGMAEPQDPLQAEVEEAELLHREVELEAARRVTAQQIAALLHRTDATIPPAPAQLEPVAAPVEAEPAALARAVEERPELRSAEARVRARAAGADLARRAHWPDFRVMGSYDRSWDETDMRPMLGVELNVPLPLARRRAAVEEALAELERARRERERLQDEIHTELRTATERLAAARHGLEIARDRLLPAARDRLAAARSGFETGRVAFGDVIEAERALRDAELGAEAALAETSRRAAELLAAHGQPPGLPAGAPTEAEPHSDPRAGASESARPFGARHD
jgi:outer membrane protein TolC